MNRKSFTPSFRSDKVSANLEKVLSKDYPLKESYIGQKWTNPRTCSAIGWELLEKHGLSSEAEINPDVL